MTKHLAECVEFSTKFDDIFLVKCHPRCPCIERSIEYGQRFVNPIIHNEQIKLWHDDIRRPPDSSWVWARTNDEAQRALTTLSDRIVECSLDHDLGLHLNDPDAPDADMQAGWDVNNDGFQLVKWMVKNNRVPPKVTIHSWNPDGAKNMAGYLLTAMRNGVIGHAKVIVQPFRRNECPRCHGSIEPAGFCDNCKDYTGLV